MIFKELEYLSLVLIKKSFGSGLVGWPIGLFAPSPKPIYVGRQELIRF